jgi:hypothetical protein
MRSTSTVYVTTQAEYDKFREKLKESVCPRCSAVGCLIRHGYLRGYGETAVETIQRGWRVFCSNRGRKQGCGGTYAILLAHHLYRRLVGASRLWTFLKGILAGASVKSAWEAGTASFSLEAGYKLWASYLRNQSAIRVRLHSLARPVSSAVAPALQTIAHLNAAFPQADCPVTAFQRWFQSPFLAP